MAEKLNVEWSDKAKDDLQRIYNLLINSWSEKEAEQFLDLVFEFESTIVRYPEAFRKSNKLKGARLGFIHRHTSAVYKIENDTIFILTLFDNRSEDTFR